MQDNHVIHGCCLLLGLVSLAVGAWALFTGQVSKLGVDGLFLLIVCLLFAATFLWSPLGAMRAAARRRQAQKGH